jgi:GT2 family glycosyltransferase
MSELPTISLIVLNWNGREHLSSCLESLSRLDYPHERLELIVCDNGSTDGSASYVRSSFPTFRLLELDRNYGFAVGNDRAAEAATGEWVGFLNNDMAVPPDWLRQLLAPLQAHPEVTCLASRILNWDGSAIDFIGGGINFQGHGLQLDNGAKRSVHDRARPVLFACGGAMLVKRQLFLDVGGFDPLYFSLFEDVDLGWRLNLLGHDVWYTPKATVLHKHHATLNRFKPQQLNMLTERNALFTIFKNYDQANLDAVMPVALMLLNEKALSMAGIDKASYRPGANAGSDHTELVQPPPVPRLTRKNAAQKALRIVRQEGWRQLARKSAKKGEGLLREALRRPARNHGPMPSSLPELALSHLVAISEFAHNLAELESRREWLQSRRKRSDEEVLGLEKVLLSDPSYGNAEYLEFQQWLSVISGVEDRFKKVKL